MRITYLLTNNERCIARGTILDAHAYIHTASSMVATLKRMNKTILISAEAKNDKELNHAMDQIKEVDARIIIALVYYSW